jgi:hypothetical protein
MMPTPDNEGLEELLNAAGRDAQPKAVGWETLPARLAGTVQQKPRSLGRWGTLPIGVAVVAALVLIALVMMRPSPRLQAQDKPIEVRRESIDLTILSLTETQGETLYMPLQPPAERQTRKTGQALVKDRRLVLNLKPGDNVVRFTDVAATIDPTSVRFESLTDPTGTTVVEQSFEYDLATSDALLKRFLEREVVVIDREDGETAGYLESYDADAIVLAKTLKGADRETQSFSRQSLRALRLAEMPADLVVRPTLVWKLRTRTPGQHKTMVTYLCGQIQWQAEYVVEVTPGEPGQPDLLDWSAWVTVENTSGSTYPEAGLRLISGDVRRIQELWKKEKESGAKVLASSDFFDRDEKPPVVDSTFGRRFFAITPEFAEKSLFEYHLYTLNTPFTVGDHQIKQLSLLKKIGVKVTRRYVFDPADGQRPLDVELLVKNKKDNQLGVPLPLGQVTLEQRGVDGETAFIGSQQIEHTAVNEELRLRYARAFDVVGEHCEIQVEKLNKNARVTYETKIRNRKAIAVAAKCFGVRLGNNAILREASMPHQMQDAQTFFFEFTLPANEERTIRYTVVYKE